MLSRTLLFGGAMAVAVAACSGDTASTGAFGNCPPGEVRACVGPAACQGTQVCEPDGAGYSLCDCRGGSSVGGGSTGVGAGATTTAGSGAGTTSTTGAGGAGGSGGGQPMGCDAEATCVACAACTQTDDCAQAWAACDASCLDAVQCASTCEAFCGGDTSCFDDCATTASDSCANQFPTGYSLAQAVSACACQACPTACAGIETCGALSPTVCDETGFVAAANPRAVNYGTMLEVQIPQLGSNGIDLLLVELHYADGATDQPRVIQLSGEGFDTCVDCLRIRSHVGGTYFLAQSGRMEIVANGSVGGTFTLDLQDVTLVEVTIDPATRQSTVVPNGARWCIASLVTSVPITAGTGACTSPPNDPLFNGACNGDLGTCTGPCELVSQCGCAPGASCTLNFANGDHVCTTAGTATSGQACTSTTDCAAGHACLNGNGLMSCFRFCDSNDDCVGTGACDVTVSGQTAKWCTQSCDPLTSAGCLPAQSCTIDTSSPAFTWCRTEGAGGLGAACTTGNDCADGYTCVTVNAAPQATCQPWCNVGSPVCPGATTCTGFGTPLMLGPTEYGACI